MHSLEVILSRPSNYVDQEHTRRIDIGAAVVFQAIGYSFLVLPSVRDGLLASRLCRGKNELEKVGSVEPYNSRPALTCWPSVDMIDDRMVNVCSISVVFRHTDTGRFAEQFLVFERQLCPIHAANGPDDDGTSIFAELDSVDCSLGRQYTCDRLIPLILLRLRQRILLRLLRGTSRKSRRRRRRQRRQRHRTRIDCVCGGVVLVRQSFVGQISVRPEQRVVCGRDESSRRSTLGEDSSKHRIAITAS